MAQSFDGIDTVLLDIEGTICPITFVRDTLFPYAIEALPRVLKEKWDDPEFVPYRQAFPDDAKTSPENLEAHVQDLTRRDVKIAYLKNLQGYLWREGYESGAYSTPLFEDVLPALRRWRGGDLHISIYSSGSVYAQQLLFGHVRGLGSEVSKEAGDQRALVEEWFDTVNAGPKTESKSYEKIADKLGKNAAQVLFFSDNVLEVRAATEAGMQAILIERPGNSPLLPEDRRTYRTISSFNELDV